MLLRQVIGQQPHDKVIVPEGFQYGGNGVHVFINPLLA
jgi:hypothetical protein